MIRYGKQYYARFNEPDEKRLYEQEKLLFDATELISKLMERENISRSALAERLGKSKAYVTQVLRGQANMTLRTLADLMHAMGYSIKLAASHPQRASWSYACPWQPSMPTTIYRTAAASSKFPFTSPATGQGDNGCNEGVAA